MATRVLVVDDDEHVLRAVSTALRRAGYVVTTANDGVPAMAFTAPVDVVLADYNLRSDATGADVVRHFKARHGNNVVCFVLSGEDDFETREACLAAGAIDVLLKPVSTAQLRERLADADRMLGAA